METCENCGTPIGKLETPCVWKGAVVCVPCYAKLCPPPSRTHPARDPDAPSIARALRPVFFVALLASIISAAVAWQHQGVRDDLEFYRTLYNVGIGGLFVSTACLGLTYVNRGV